MRSTDVYTFGNWAFVETARLLKKHSTDISPETTNTYLAVGLVVRDDWLIGQHLVSDELRRDPAVET